MRDFITCVLRRIFRPGWKWLSLPSIASAVVIAAALYALFSDSFKDLLSFGHSHQTAAKIIAAVFILLLIIALLYAINATVEALDLKRLSDIEKQSLRTANSNIQIQFSDLQKEKQRLIENGNWHDLLAQAMGVRVHELTYRCEVTNYDGDARISQEEDFEVLGTPLTQIVRPISSDSATKRINPTIDVLHLPNGVTLSDRKFRDHGGTRYFCVSLYPGLERTAKPALLLIKDETARGFYMSREEVPPDWEETPGMERASFIAVGSVGKLTISVRFPFGYEINEADAHARVCHGRSTTRHPLEESRLERENALHFERQMTGGIQLRLEVVKPIPGLRYFLCWLPMTQEGLNRVKNTLIPKKEGERP